MVIGTRSALCLRPLTLVAAVATWLMPGCFVDVAIGEDANLACEQDADCPAPMTCQVDAGRCAVPGQSFDTTAPQVTGVTSSAAVIAADGTATISITATEGLASADVRVEGDTDALIAAVDGAGASVQVDAAGRAGGAIRLAIVLTDLAGNASGEVRVAPGLVIDPSAPDIQRDSVVVRPGVDNVLFPGVADAARADSTVLVEIGWDEAPTAVTALVATDVAGAEVTLDVPITLAGAGATVTLEPGALALLSDGSWTLGVSVEDAVGNRAERSLSSRLVIDTTPPPTPTLDLLERAPFGDAQPVARARVTGTATGALLVLAVPAGVTIDPARVPPALARLPVVDGAFDGAIGVDVPGLRVVAVDAAGNLSAAATATRVSLFASTVLAASPHELHARPVVAAHLRQRGDVRVDDVLRRDGTLTTRSAVFWRPATTVRRDILTGRPIVAADPIAGGLIAVADGFTFRIHHGQVEQLAVPRLAIRENGAMATDTRRGRIVLFGGKDGEGAVRNDLLEWDGRAWRTVLAHAPGATDRPRPREGHSMTNALGGVVVVGGCGGDRPDFLGCAVPIPLEVWRWDGEAFTALCSGTACGAGPAPIRPDLTADVDGTLLASGGLNDQFLNFLALGAPRVSRFTNNTFVAECDGACADAFPGDGVAVFDGNHGAPAFVGTCSDGPCLAHLEDGELHVTALSAPVPLETFPLQQRAVAVDGDRILVVGDGGVVTGILEGQAGTIMPRTLARRCGGAAVVDDGDVMVLGGCQACRRGNPEGLCSQPLVSAVAPAAVDPRRADTPVSGHSFAVPLATDTLVASVTFPGGAVGVTRLRRLSDLTTALPDLGLGSHDTGLGNVPRSSVGAWPVGDRAMFIQGFVDTISLADVVIAGLEPPVLGVDLDGAATEACGAGCFNALSGTGDGRGTMIARARTGGMLFGGERGGGSFSPTTALLDDAGVASAVPDGPIGRAAGSLVYDPEREVTWLFGGAVGDSFDFPPASCNVVGNPLCSDLWRFDGATWQEVVPVDITGFGGPPGRVFAQAASVGGGLVVSGGAASAASFPTDGLTDAWELLASSTQAMSHQLRASYATSGDDAGGVFDGLRVRWCGGATDATGATVPVALRVWVGGGWRLIGATAEGACLVGVLEPAGLTDLILDEDLGLVVEALPELGRAGTRDPSLTTTTFVVETFFVPG